jgi:membrane protein required for colicin V production
MQGLDLIIILFIAFLLIKGVWKGFVKEIAGIIAVGLAVVLSFLYHKDAAEFLANYLDEKYTTAVGYVVVFLVVYLTVMLTGNLIDKILKTVFLGGINRILGGVFGIVKSALWLTIASFAYQTAYEGIGFQHPEWIVDSQFYPFFVDLGEIAKSYLT